MTTPPSPKAPNRTVLDQLPLRVVTFLRGVATHPEVRLAMQSVGYSGATHAEGLSLLHAVLAFGGAVDPASYAVVEETRAALRSIDEFVRTHGARLEAAVARRLPDEDAGLLARTSNDPTASVVAVVRLLDQLDAKPADSPLVALLADRGLTRERRDELRAQSRRAMRAAPTGADVDPIGFSTVRLPELVALYAWHREWSLAARSVVKRADLRMRIGIGERWRAVDT